MFHDTYSCVLNITVHTILLDYKFRDDDSEIVDYSKLSQYFFPLYSRNVPDESIERVFKEYIQTLANGNNRLRRLIKRISKKNSSASYKRNLKHSLKPPLTFTAENTISEAIQTRNKKKLAKIIMLEIKEVASSVYQMRFELTNLLKNFSTELVRYLEEKYHEKVRSLCMEHFYREIQIGELNIVANLNPAQSKTARAHRKSLYSAKKEKLEIFNVKIFSPEKLAVLFEEISIKSGDLKEN